MAGLQRSPQSGRENHAEALQQERKRQIRGLMLLAFAVLLFVILRAGVSNDFTPRWWRLW
ncbi:hypothetical protein [Edaphobacter aggregans]|uniref:hypothetical protein n=1 Tax=Edaphobacter aggregans TaxID=570835 RepID=UPI00055252F4|nr:hypothetical protein [Edaphobacter aggregans]